MKYLVKATSKWKDMNLECKDTNNVPEVGFQWEVDQERMKELVRTGLAIAIGEAKETATPKAKKKAEKKDAKGSVQK